MEFGEFDKPSLKPVEPSSVLPLDSDSATSASIPHQSSEQPLNDDSPELSADTIFTQEPVQEVDFPRLDRDASGYTIIVGSFATIEQALSIMNRYQEIYPNIPVDTLVSDDMRYRVALGQTPTISEAVTLKDRLIEVPTDAWIKNIQNVEL